MTMLLVFLPIIIIMGILIAFVSFRSNFTLFGWVNGKRAYLILSVYMVLLLVAAGVYMFGPKSQTTGRDELNSEEHLTDMNQAIFDVTQGEQSVDILEGYIKNQEIVPFEANELTVEFSSSHYLSSFVVIDQTDNQINELELTFYETPIYGSGINLNNHIEHLSYQLKDDTLTIKDPYKETEITIVTLTSEFTFDQFMKKEDSSDAIMNQEQNSIQINPDVLYIRAPKDLTIDLGSYEEEVYRVQ